VVKKRSAILTADHDCQAAFGAEANNMTMLRCGVAANQFFGDALNSLGETRVELGQVHPIDPIGDLPQLLNLGRRGRCIAPPRIQPLHVDEEIGFPP
jgi:hypothetical protein